jgi:hypothetical protein
MVKRYSIPTEKKAKELILNLASQNNEEEQDFKQITITEFTNGIVVLGFQNVYKFNEETQESELIKEGTTYDIDIFWKVEPLEEFNQFEVNPKTPNHKFA